MAAGREAKILARGLAGDDAACVEHPGDDRSVDLGYVALRTREPFIIGTPATQMQSLTATVLPASTPLPLPLMSVFQYQALYLFSSGLGR